MKFQFFKQQVRILHTKTQFIGFGLILVSMMFRSCSALAKDSNEHIRIGVLQHFGKSRGDAAEFAAADENTSLNAICKPTGVTSQSKPDESFVTNGFKLGVVAVPSTVPPKQPNRLIVSSHRTYESAHYKAELMNKLFPQLNWRVLYPSPWQVAADMDRDPRPVMDELNKLGVASAWTNRTSPTRLALSVFSKNGFEIVCDTLRLSSNKSIKLNKQRFAGSFEVNPDSFGSFSVINELPLEEYLRGVVPFEVGADAPPAALRVQAILARTYALANRRRFEPEGYELCATQHCQVYKGLGGTNAKIDKAIAETLGLVVLSPEGELAPVFYYSTDGGFSANYTDIWPSLPNHPLASLRGIPTCAKSPRKLDLSKEQDLKLMLTDGGSWDCYDAVSSRFRWKKSFDSAELTQIVLKAAKRWKFAWPAFSTVHDIVVDKRSNTGRITSLIINTDTSSIIVKLDEIRAALGGLDSTLFVIDKSIDPESGEKRYELQGAGFGHGVGLSQFGARTLAKLGRSHQDIIQIYFPQFQIGSLHTK